ncbi:hypothetical protein EHS25_009060 [Saitozyma podzolica]|uniref:Protein ZIP4 homolog n=1 Tax=Saitozyma podzolica TaxID=1890683 RepID=A0A427YKY0_9TREE|nr:hypothetical protein EHS25_009060 [Saitozyma podzolica]
MSREPFTLIQATYEQLRPLLNHLPITSSSPPEVKHKLLQLLQHLRAASEDRYSQQSQTEAEDPTTAASLRYTAFRMIEAASEPKLPLTLTLRLLELACATVTSLVEAKETEDTSGLLTRAADLAQRVSAATLAPDSIQAKQRSGVLIKFYVTRVDSIMAEDENARLALSFMKRALELELEGHFSQLDYLALAARCWSIGDKLRKQSQAPGPSFDEGGSAHDDAVEWLSTGMKIIEHMENRFQNPGYGGVMELKLALLRSLARAYLSKSATDPTALAQAETTLKILASLVVDRDPSAEFDIKLLQLRVLKQQDAAEGDIRALLGEIWRCMVWDEESAEEMLAQIHGLGSHPDLVSSSLVCLIHEALKTADGHAPVERILLMILVTARHMMETRAPAAYQMALQALDLVSSQEEFEARYNTHSTAEETVIWDIADKQVRNNRYEQAAQWYELATHPAFAKFGSKNFSQCRRRAALAYINAGDYEAAARLIALCPAGEAATQYLRFLVAINSGSVKAAIEAVHLMIECADVQGKQLILMASVAYEKGAEATLMKVLSIVLEALDGSDIIWETHIERITLIRCLIRLTLLEIEKAEEKETLLGTLVGYFATGEPAAAFATSLTKYSYNTGIRAALEWGSQAAPDLFDCAAQLMIAYEDLTQVDLDPELELQKGSAMFACLCGKLFACRDLEDGPDRSDLLANLATYLPSCRGTLMGVNHAITKQGAVEDMLRALDIYEVEVMCEMGEWDSLLESIKASDNAIESRLATRPGAHSHPSHTLESIADVLASYPKCPTSTTYLVLEMILTSFSLASSGDVIRYARWLRAILLNLLHRGGEEDADRALAYLTKGAEVLRSTGGKAAYPADEAQWLLAQAWNKGLELFSSGKVDSARTWSEVAISISSSLPNGGKQKDQLYAQYQYLLERSSAR